MALPTPTTPAQVPGEILRGRISVIFCTTVANFLSPTSAELTAGTDYKRLISAIGGFAPTGNTVDYMNAATRLVGNVPGTITMGTGDITFNLPTPGSGGTDVRSVFSDGSDGVTATTSGYWYLLHDGISASGKMRGFQASCISATVPGDLDTPKNMVTTWSISAATGYIAVPTV